MTHRRSALGPAAAAVLVLATGWASAQLAGPVSDPVSDPLVANDAQLNPLAILGEESMSDFLGRPLLSPSRAPPPIAAPAEPAEATTETVTQAPPDIRLVGVMQTPRERIALIQHGIEGSTAATLSLREGDYIDQWLVFAIAPNTITLKQDERETTLGLQSAEPSSAASGAPAPSPGVPAPSPGVNGSASSSQPQPDWTLDDLIGFFGEDARP